MPFTPQPVKRNITIDDLNKLDIRAGTIERVEDVPKSDKLVRLTVSFSESRKLNPT